MSEPEQPSYIQSIPFTGGQLQLGATQDEYETLTASHEMTDQGGLIVTEWKPSPEQVQRLVNGDSIFLGVLCGEELLFQPVQLAVGTPSEVLAASHQTIKDNDLG